MAKIIQIEIPDWVEEEEIRKDLMKIIALKSIEGIGTEVSEEEIDELAEEIKKDIWERLKKCLSS